MYPEGFMHMPHPMHMHVYYNKSMPQGPLPFYMPAPHYVHPAPIQTQKPKNPFAAKINKSQLKQPTVMRPQLGRSVFELPVTPKEYNSASIFENERNPHHPQKIGSPQIRNEASRRANEEGYHSEDNEAKKFSKNPLLEVSQPEKDKNQLRRSISAKNLSARSEESHLEKSGFSQPQFNNNVTVMINHFGVPPASKQEPVPSKRPLETDEKSQKAVERLKSFKQSFKPQLLKDMFKNSAAASRGPTPNNLNRYSFGVGGANQPPPLSISNFL
jgi:hypothetical protein